MNMNKCVRSSRIRRSDCAEVAICLFAVLMEIQIFWKFTPRGSLNSYPRLQQDVFMFRVNSPNVCLLVPSPPVVTVYTSVSQPPGRGPVPGPCINYTGPREILLELITNLNVILYLSTCHTVHMIVLILFMIMP